MADQEQKGRQLLAEAEKKIASSKGFASSFFGGASKIEDAIDCYKRAAIAFKQAKNWKECGNAYCQAGGLYTKTDSKHDAAQCFIDAGNAYKKIDPLDAVNCISKAIEIYTDMGRFTMAAKNYQNIAEIYENEANNLEKAIEYYEKAADCFQGEESRTSANKCFLKVAQYSAHLEQYEKAIQIYEQVASDALKSPLLKHSAKEYYFRAALCHLCVDSLNAQHAIERYQDECPPFQDAREYKLVKTIIGHIEEQNAEGYTEAVKDYDSISRLDQWYTTILLRIKKQINENPDLR